MKKITIVLTMLISSLFSVFATSYLGGLVEFNLPTKLEVQSDEMQSFSDTYLGVSNAADLILQQKGLNNRYANSLDRYCRIMFYNTPTDAVETNKEIFEEFDRLSDSEKKEVFDYFKDEISSDNVVKKFIETKVTSVGGVKAFKISFTRESVVEKSDVYCEYYFIYSKGKTITMVCSYRLSDKGYFSDAISDFFSSLKFNLNESNLYIQTLPHSKKTFLWPQAKISWDKQYESGATSNIATLDLSTTEGYLVSISEIKAGISCTTDLLKIVMSKLVNTIKTKSLPATLGKYNYKLTKDNYLKDQSAYIIAYEYKALGKTIEGFTYFEILDDYSYMILVSEYLSECKSIIDEIAASVM